MVEPANWRKSMERVLWVARELSFILFHWNLGASPPSIPTASWKRADCQRAATHSPMWVLYGMHRFMYAAKRNSNHITTEPVSVGQQCCMEDLHSL